MSITLSLPPETERKLKEQAAQSGQGLEEYLRALIEKVVEGAERVTPSSEDTTPVHEGMPLDEVLAPVHQQFDESGMTEEELDALIEEAREEVWREKQGRNAS